MARSLRTPPIPFSPNGDRGVAILRLEGEFRVVATLPFAAGERVLVARGATRRTPTRHSLQVGARTHLDLAGPLETLMDRHPWRFLNHACEPNCAFVGRALVAVRELRPWEELTFHYATTEDDMAEPFRCHCGSPRCLGLIRGFRHLPPEEVERLWPLLSEHLRRAWEARKERERRLA